MVYCLHRDWNDYESGFGDLAGNYWMGLENLSRMTSASAVQIHIYLDTFDDDWAYAAYDSFHIADSSDDYRLTVSGYHGTAGDAFTALTNFANGMKFTTRDRDNDNSGRNCAQVHKGAWWYNSCHRSNLNGLYLAGELNSLTAASGVIWSPFRGLRYSLKTAVMKIRPRD